MRCHSRVAILALAAGLGAGCAGIEVMSPPPPAGSGTTGTGATGGSGGSSPQTLLLGVWTRAIYVEGIDGDLHESRTTWDFRGDGSAVRTVRAWNVSEGIYDVVVNVAQWRVSNSSLTIAWVPPGSGSTTFQLKVERDLLQIGSEQYARVR